MHERALDSRSPIPPPRQELTRGSDPAATGATLRRFHVDRVTQLWRNGEVGSVSASGVGRRPPGIRSPGSEAHAGRRHELALDALGSLTTTSSRPRKEIEAGKGRFRPNAQSFGRAQQGFQRRARARKTRVGRSIPLQAGPCWLASRARLKAEGRPVSSFGVRRARKDSPYPAPAMGRPATARAAQRREWAWGPRRRQAAGTP
jgi:hypothetical protein